METLASRPSERRALTLQRRNGSSLPIEFSTAPLRGGEGKDLGVIGVFRDLTPVRQLESSCGAPIGWPRSARSPPGSPTRSRTRSPRC